MHLWFRPDASCSLRKCQGILISELDPKERGPLLIPFHKRSDKQAAVYECSYAVEADLGCYFATTKNVVGNLEFGGFVQLPWGMDV